MSIGSFKTRIRQALTHRDTLIEAVERAAAKDCLAAYRALLKPFNLKRHSIVIHAAMGMSSLWVEVGHNKTLYDDHHVCHVKEDSPLIQMLNFINEEVSCNYSYTVYLDGEMLNTDTPLPASDTPALSDEASLKIAALHKEAEVRASKIKKEQEVIGKLAITPRFVFVYELYKCSGTIKYEAKTPQQVLDIIAAFNPVPAYVHRKNGTAAICCYPTDDGHASVDIDLRLKIDSMPTVEFFILLDGEHWRVGIEFPIHWIGRWVKDNPRARTNFKYYFEAKQSYASIVNYGGASHFGDGSKKQSIVHVTREQIAEWGRS